MAEQITITQARRALVLSQSGPGRIIYDGTRGNASYEASKSAIEALIASLQKTLQNSAPVPYGTDPLGEPEHVSIALEGLRREFGPALQDKQIGLFPGAQFGIFAAMYAVLKQKGNAIAIQEPGYPNYAKIFELAKTLANKRGAEVIGIRLDEENNITAANIAETIKAGEDRGKEISLVIITSPSNPQGKIPPEAEQKRIVELIQQHPNTFFILDESSIEMDYRENSPNRFRSMAAGGAAEIFNNTFIIRSGTKAAAMAGFRPNLAILPNDEQIIASIKSVTSTILGNPGFAEQILMSGWIRSLDDKERESISKHYAANLKPLVGALDRLKIPYISPDGGFFLTIDLNELINQELPPEIGKILGKTKLKTDEDIFELLLKVGHINGSEKLGVMPGSDFGYQPTEGKVRFCFGGPAENSIGAARVITNVANRIREHNLSQQRIDYIPVAEPRLPVRKHAFSGLLSKVAAVVIGLFSIFGLRSNPQNQQMRTTQTHLAAGDDLTNYPAMRSKYEDRVVINHQEVPLKTFCEVVAPFMDTKLRFSYNHNNEQTLTVFDLTESQADKRFFERVPEAANASLPGRWAKLTLKHQVNPDRSDDLPTSRQR